MFCVDSGNALGSAKGLELRLARRWNELLSHYDDSETGKGIRNVQYGKTLLVVETVKGLGDVVCRMPVSVDGKERNCDGRRTRKNDFSVQRFCVYIGRCWRRRKNKDRNTLSRSWPIYFTFSPSFM